MLLFTPAAPVAEMVAFIFDGLSPLQVYAASCVPVSVISGKFMIYFF